MYPLGKSNVQVSRNQQTEAMGYVNKRIETAEAFFEYLKKNRSAEVVTTSFNNLLRSTRDFFMVGKKIAEEDSCFWITKYTEKQFKKEFGGLFEEGRFYVSEWVD